MQKVGSAEGCSLKEDQPLLRLLLNLLFYRFNRSEPTYKNHKTLLMLTQYFVIFTMNIF